VTWGTFALIAAGMTSHALAAKPMKLRRVRNARPEAVPVQFESIIPEPVKTPAVTGPAIASAPEQFESLAAEPGAEPQVAPPFVRSGVRRRIVAPYFARPIGRWLSSCGGPGVTPLGESIRCPMNTQIANGHAGRLVFFQYDFVNDESRDMSVLNDAGLRKLRRLMPTIQYTAFPLTIERVPGRDELSELRRMHLLEHVSAMASVPVPDHRVIIGDVHPGLYGGEALLIDATMLGITRSTGLAGGQSGLGSTINVGSGR
jgi:hypothetical protein